MGAQARQQAGAPESRGSVLLQLLPLLLLFGFSLLNALPSLFAGPSYPDPQYAFTPSARYDTERSTSNLNIKYHINGAELRNHPVLGAELARAGSGSSNASPGKGMSGFEDTIERTYTREVRICSSTRS
jgi:DnaJ family protein B protein 12